MIPRITHPFVLLALLVALFTAAIGAPARAGGFDQALTIWARALEARLVTLEETARAEGVPTSTRIARGPVLKPGMVDERVLQLSLRLIELGYLPPGSERDIHDDIVVAAVSVFQAERGLNPDGKVGGATLASLNVTPAEEIASIRETLTRMAEFRASAPATLVVVNLPAQELALVRDGETILTMDTAVGRPSRPTPLLANSDHPCHPQSDLDRPADGPEGRQAAEPAAHRLPGIDHASVWLDGSGRSGPGGLDQCVPLAGPYRAVGRRP